MAQNTGTLITAPIRPNDSLDPIASAFGNEIKGGHHSYATLTERDNIILSRREWGMLCTVYNDGVNNGTYKLEYNYSSITLTDNNNWVLFNSANSETGEWLSSVISIVSSPPTSNDGDRYLVSTSGAGAFSGQNNKIAVYDSSFGGSGGWIFYGPTQGTSLRVDDQKNVIYKWNSSNWVQDVVNQVRFISASSSNGLSYTASSTVQESIDLFSYSVFYTTFNMTNSGTLSLAIDSLSSIEVKKIIGTSFQSLQSGDVIPGVQYQLLYNSGFFQTQLPQSSVSTIGPAEDGSYTDGLYTDFTPTTPIGTPVDRFNELFKLIVPPNAPTMSSWSATGSFVNGGLSFDGSIGGFSTATQSPYGSVGRGETFSNLLTPYRLGITSRVSQPLTGDLYYQDISGVFNINVPQSTQTPTPAWATYSFGYATTGTVSLYLNGSTISSTGLSTTTSIDLTSGGATSGLNLSSATSSKFPFGDGFDSHQNRTGTYLIKRDNSSILEGYNWISVKHDIGSQVYELSRYEWVADGSTAGVVFAFPVLSQLVSSSKHLSGIQYRIAPITLTYQLNISNLFRNTFVNDNFALQYLDVSSVISGTNGVVSSTNTSQSMITPALTFSAITGYTPAFVTPTQNINIFNTYTVNSNVRRLNDPLGTSIICRRTVQGTFSGGTSSSSGWFVDTYPASSTPTIENFDDETYRLINYNDKYNSYNYLSDIFSIFWQSSYSLVQTGNNQGNGLQVINGTLVYPRVNFSNLGTSGFRNPNLNNALTNYSNAYLLTTEGHGTQSGVNSNFRTYTRVFYFDPTANYSKFILGLSWSGTSFTTPTTSLLSSATDVWVEFKLVYDSGTPPGGTISSGAQTGWLDATTPFVPGNYDNGDGCFDGTLSDTNWNTVSNANWGINFGVQGTYWSGGYVLMRITAGPSWTGFIDRIVLTPST